MNFLKIGLLLFCSMLIAECLSGQSNPDSLSTTYDSLNLYPTGNNEIVFLSARKKILHPKFLNKQLTQAENTKDFTTQINTLLDLSDTYLAYGNNKKAFTYLTETLRLKDSIADEQTISRLYYNMAVVLTHLKKYSEAIKCFYKTGLSYQQTYLKRKRKKTVAIDTSSDTHLMDAYLNKLIDDNIATQIFADSVIDNSLLSVDTALLNNNPILEDSPDADYNDIIDAFYDDKPAFAFSILLHIKQPIAGKTNVFTRINKVGHTFITLLKYNIDNTIVSKTFGFYPEKDNIISATPLIPFTNSRIRNDSLHDWDETIGKFISAKKFEQILDFVDEAATKKYNLNTNNCTDFGLHIADIAGIKIADTKSNWPLGRGNNPATTGQSILRGKFINTDTQNQRGMFACSNNLFIHKTASNK